MIFINSSSKDSFKIFQSFSPIFVPFGIGYLMATLDRNNIKSYYVDEVFEKDAFEKILEICKNINKPYIFGFNVLTVSYKNALILSVKLKNKFPESIVVFGGIHSTMMPEESLLNDTVDIVVRGEAENIIVDLFNCLKRRNYPTQLNGISYKSGGKIIHNSENFNQVRLSELPEFPYKYFENNNYNLGYVMTARGCPYNCIFCSKISRSSNVRFMEKTQVLDNLEILYEKYNIKHVGFLDDDFLCNQNRVYDLCELLRSSKLYNKMTFSFAARADNCNAEVLKMMYSSGFRSVFLGFETASEDIMKSLKKGEKLTSVIEAIKVVKNANLSVSTNFIFGLPGENREVRRKAFKYAKDLKLDLVKYNNATPFPGTELYNIAVAENRLNVVGKYENFLATAVLTENPFKKIRIPFVPKGNTENQIRYDILFGTFIFYFNFRRLKYIFTKQDLSNSWYYFGKNAKELSKNIFKILILFVILFIKFSEMLILYPFLSKNRNR